LLGRTPVAVAYAVGPTASLNLAHRMTVLEDLKAQREGLLGIGFWHCCVPFGHARFVIRNNSAGSLDDCLHHTQKLGKFSAASSSGQPRRIGRRLVHRTSRLYRSYTGQPVIGDDCLIRTVYHGNSGADDPLGAPRSAIASTSVLVRRSSAAYG